MPAPSCDQAASTAVFMQDWGWLAGATTISAEKRYVLTNLFEGLGVEASEGVVLNGIADLDWGQQTSQSSM